MANSVDPDEVACYELFHLDLHCLHQYLFLVYQTERVKSCKQNIAKSAGDNIYL